MWEKKKILQKWSGTNVDEGWWATKAFKNLQTPNVTNHDIAPVKYQFKPLPVWLPDIFYVCPEHPLECWDYECAVLAITKYSSTNLQSAGSQHYLDLIMRPSFHPQSQRLCFFRFKKKKKKIFSPLQFSPCTTQYAKWRPSGVSVIFMPVQQKLAVQALLCYFIFYPLIAGGLVVFSAILSCVFSFKTDEHRIRSALGEQKKLSWLYASLCCINAVRSRMNLWKRSTPKKVRNYVKL